MTPWYTIPGGFLFALGAVVVATNLYLVVLRYPLHRLRGRDRESFRFVSAVPVVGQVLLIVGCQFLHGYPVALRAGLVLVLIDCGGLHVALLAFAWFSVASLFRPRSTGR